MNEGGIDECKEVKVKVKKKRKGIKTMFKLVALQGTKLGVVISARFFIRQGKRDGMRTSTAYQSCIKATQDGTKNNQRSCMHA